MRFGTVWGNASSGISGLAQDRDWYFDTNTQLLYVYCGGCSGGVKPAGFFGSVVPIVSPTTMVNLNGSQYVEAQHLLVDWYASYGVQVQGGSDHIWLANIVANSEVENGAVPLGFYVHPNGTPVDIHLYNTDANMNYAGYRFDGCAGGGCAYEIKNCRAYANRAYGIIDNVQGSVSYDYCQPGRMRLAEDRITMLERSDIRRNLLDRMVTAAIAFVVSALIALHDHLLPK